MASDKELIAFEMGQRFFDIENALSTIMDEVEKANVLGLHCARVIIDPDLTNEVMFILREGGYEGYVIEDGVFRIFWKPTPKDYETSTFKSDSVKSYLQEAKKHQRIALNMLQRCFPYIAEESTEHYFLKDADIFARDSITYIGMLQELICEEGVKNVV